MKTLFLLLFLGMAGVDQAGYADNLPLSDQQIAVLRSAQPDINDGATLTWRGDPISIALPLAQEKRLVFPEPIEADINGSLTNDQLRIINNNQNLYLTAKKAFSKTRIYVTLKNSQQIILLDIVTADNANTNLQKIILPKANNSTGIVEAKVRHNPPDDGNDEKMTSADAYVNAIRFGWQQLYAPQRLFNSDSGFVRTPMRSAFWTPDLIYGDKVLAHPEASWQLDGLYVTAIELRNKYSHATVLNMSQDLCGDWQAATLYPRTHLKPAGDKSGDAATLLLISNKPFSDALEVCHGGA